MSWRRVQQYAATHARLRARLGIMPDADRWRYIAGGADLDAVVQRMRDGGLGHWVHGLPRNPDIATIEQALIQGLVGLTRDIAGWLPKNWRDVKRWLEDGLTVIFIRRLLRTHAVKLPAGIDPLLVDVAQAPLERRGQVLAATRYARYLGAAGTEFDRWLAHFETVRPPSHGREAYVIDRLQRLVATHNDTIRVERGRWRKAQDTAALNQDAQWRLRDELGARAMILLSGESFHAGAVLIYGMLELLQFERARALLTARCYEWEHARFA